MSLTDSLTPERVRAGAARVREHVDRVPVELRGLAEAGLDVLETEADQVASVGRDLLSEGLSLVQLGRVDEARLRYLRHLATADERLAARRAAREGAEQARAEIDARHERLADGFLGLLQALVKTAGPVALSLVQEALK